MRGRVGLGLVPADQDDRIPGLGVGERHARVRRSGDRERDAWHHFEWNPLLVQEDRFLAAAVEDERISPLQPDDSPALTSLLGEEIGDRVLIERFGRRRADVDPLRRPRRRREQTLRHAMVVDHHVGPAKTLRPRTLMSDGSPGPAPTI